MITKSTKQEDYLKASRKGSREAELEVSVGWKSNTKVHKSKKTYNRKCQGWKSELGVSFLANNIKFDNIYENKKR